jgi:hypothetical protein
MGNQHSPPHAFPPPSTLHHTTPHPASPLPPLSGRPLDSIARYGDHGAEVGFQGQDPATDLRAAGILGLVHLRFLQKVGCCRCYCSGSLCLGTLLGAHETSLKHSLSVHNRPHHE